MIDQPPAIVLGIADDGGRLASPGGLGQAHDMAELLHLAPMLANHPLALAQAVNHFAHGGDYQVIADPKAFEAEYRAKLAKEDPNAPFQAGVIRLRDHGVPDFTTLHPPALRDGRLLFYVVDTFLGVPYAVDCASLTAAPVYAPLPLTPLPAPPVSPNDSQRVTPVVARTDATSAPQEQTPE